MVGVRVGVRGSSVELGHLESRPGLGLGLGEG